MDAKSAPQKRYGPVEWPHELLRDLYVQPTDNDDVSVTTETVAGWEAYFDEHAESFIDAHKPIIEKASQ